MEFRQVSLASLKRYVLEGFKDSLELLKGLGLGSLSMLTKLDNHSPCLRLFCVLGGFMGKGEAHTSED